mmetsp:Transcript_32657/g.58570  ORF Transcript_32657/g.58570 Transcript_32657/m.58570 type:complete len:82 (-) Transcript_32657:287-532(-)
MLVIDVWLDSLGLSGSGTDLTGFMEETRRQGRQVRRKLRTENRAAQQMKYQKPPESQIDHVVVTLSSQARSGASNQEEDMG